MIIQDMSHYQPSVDFPFLKSKGQNYIIFKVGGSLWIDDKFYSHCNDALASDMHVGGYYWNDPIENGTHQGEHFITAVKNEPLSFLEIDFEQWWADWAKWVLYRQGKLAGKDVPIVPSGKLLDVLKHQYDYVVANTDLNIVIYTATWFLNSYCPEAYEFLKNKYTHWADYSYFDSIKHYETWEHLEEIVPVGKPIPHLPTNYPTNKIVLFQCSGDKFIADGVWGNEERTKLSGLDLNLWVNKDISIEEFSKEGGNIVPPIVTQTFVNGIKYVRSLNVPFISQFGVEADMYDRDCGAAAAAMIIHGYTDQKPTVNEVRQATGEKADVFLYAYQLIKALNYYGVSASWKISNLQTLLIDLNSGRPVIALILYGVLVDAHVGANTTFRGFHFVTVVGYDTENIYINDPIWPDVGGKQVAVPQGVFNRAWQQAGANNSLNPAFGCLVPTDVLGVPSLFYSKYKVIASVLNVRSTPDSSSPYNIVGALHFGDIVQIENVNLGGWGKILNETKYVYMSWLVKL